MYAATAAFATTTVFEIDQNGNVSLLNGAGLTVTGALNTTGLTAGTGNGALCMTSGGLVEYSSGANCVAGGAGTVTSITAGLGLNGGAITTSGTINLKSYIATSSAETANQIPVWTTTNGTPATLSGGFSGYTLTSTGLTATNASTTQLSSGTNTFYINPSGIVGVGTTTPAASTLMQLFTTGTTTLSLDNNSTAKGACIEVKDFSGGGYTYLYTKSGILYSSTVSCK